MGEPRKPIDWEAIEREYRAGQLSVREIARLYGLAESAVRKRAAKDNWARALADKVRKGVTEKLARLDGAHDGAHGSRARTDAETVEIAALRGLNVVTSHRKDLEQLHGIKRVLMERLAQVLDGVPPVGPSIGEKETPSDMLEKLSRVTARLIPLERQAYNLDVAPSDDGGPHSERSCDQIAQGIAGKLARLAANGKTE